MCAGHMPCAHCFFGILRPRRPYVQVYFAKHAKVFFAKHARLKVVDAERTYRRECSEDGKCAMPELNNSAQRGIL